LNLAPILLFAYNRPWHTMQTVQALQNNTLAKESELIIFSDGPKDEKAAPKVTEVRNYLHSIGGFKKVTIHEQPANLGLAENIITGVTDTVNKEGQAIVLEDDILTSPVFLQFMNESLNFYRESNQVMHISGYMYPIDTKELPDTFFLKPTSCWGWATWQRAWKYFEKDPAKLVKVFSRAMINDFNLDNSRDYFLQIKDNLAGRIRTWAIFWHASVYLNNGLSLHPKKSYARNIGHDGSGEHCNPTHVFDVALNNEFTKSFPEQITENSTARKKLEEYFNKLKPSFWQLLKAKTLSILNPIKPGQP